MNHPKAMFQLSGVRYIVIMTVGGRERRQDIHSARCPETTDVVVPRLGWNREKNVRTATSISEQRQEMSCPQSRLAVAARVLVVPVRDLTVFCLGDWTEKP